MRRGDVYMTRLCMTPKCVFKCWLRDKRLGLGLRLPMATLYGGSVTGKV